MKQGTGTTGKAGDAKPNPRVGLTRERVLRTAMKLADEGGLQGLSMRELGREAGVEAMSLYNHVTSKEDLLDGMVDLVVEEISLPATGTDWRRFMVQRASSARQAFTRHPWAAALVDSRIRSGPARLRYLESVIGMLRGAGFTVELAARAFSLVDSYVYGFCRQSSHVDDAHSGGADAAEAFLRVLPQEEYPNLAAMAAMQASGPGYDEESDFEFGLDLILDGLQRILEADRANRRKPAAAKQAKAK